MLSITCRCPPSEHYDAELSLPFEQRQKSRFRACLESGEDVRLFLERGEILRNGDYLLAEDGRIVKVVAKPEPVLQVTCRTTHELTRMAYHLGNRHVPLQIGSNWLRIGADHVLREMLEALGATAQEQEAPFEPEGGAYGGGHYHAGKH